jgi:transcriptional regulator with XRE-family HTH domain
MTTSNHESPDPTQVPTSMTQREFENKRIGHTLEAARLRRKLTISDVASYLGVDDLSYRGYENGTRQLPPALVRSLCYFLCIPADVLFDVRIKPPTGLVENYLHNEIALLRSLAEGFESTCNLKHWRLPVRCVRSRNHPKGTHQAMSGFTWGTD